MQNCRESCSLLHPRDTAEHRSKFEAIYRKRWRLYMSEKFSIGTKTPIKQTNKNSIFKRGNKSTQRYKRGEVHIGGFELNTVYVLFFHAVHIYTEFAITKIDYCNFILARVFREFEVIINDCTESGFFYRFYLDIWVKYIQNPLVLEYTKL